MPLGNNLFPFSTCSLLGFIGIFPFLPVTQDWSIRVFYLFGNNNCLKDAPDPKTGPWDSVWDFNWKYWQREFFFHWLGKVGGKM